jgi:hypothetical protein
LTHPLLIYVSGAIGWVA